MRNTPRRRAKLIGGALFAASIAASSLATVSNVSADLGDGAVPGRIRVKPSSTDSEDQDAFIMKPGSTDNPAADVQLLVPSTWEAGDTITLQLRADGTAPAVHETNCTDTSHTIGYSEVPTVTVTGGPFDPAAAWGVDPGGASADYPGQDGTVTTDPRTGAGSTPTPTFIVSIKNNDSGCAAQPAYDLLEILFSNSSTGTQTSVFELTISGIKYDVGADVNAGPVHVAPYARWADESFPSVPLWSAETVFPGNDWDVAGPAGMWTNNAFIQSLTLDAISPTGDLIVTDGTTQVLGSIRLTELDAQALAVGTHDIDVHSSGSGGSNVTLSTATDVDLVTPGVQVPLSGAPTGSYATLLDVDTIRLTIGAADVVKNTITIGGLQISTYEPGTITATLVPTYDGTSGVYTSLAHLFLNPDDQVGNPAGLRSDVDLFPNPWVSAFTVAVENQSRIGGLDRYETSAKIAYNVETCTEWAVVASGLSPWDALSANYLAGALNQYTPGYIPVLLVGSTVPSSIADYLHDAGVKNIYIVGGEAAVSASVMTTLQNTLATRCADEDADDSTQPVDGQKINVTRVAGDTRYATNRAVVNLGSEIFEDMTNVIQLQWLQGSKRTALVATGTDFADALAVGPAVYDGLPLILTDGTSLSPDAEAALRENDITQVVIIGGTSAVSAAVETAILDICYEPDDPDCDAHPSAIDTMRISGADRYATATAIADFLDRGAPNPVATFGGLDWGFLDGENDEGILLASGTNFADALSGAALAWNWDAPIILTNPTALSANTKSWLEAHKTDLWWITTLGLGGAVSTAVTTAANVAIS